MKLIMDLINGDSSSVVTSAEDEYLEESEA